MAGSLYFRAAPASHNGSAFAFYPLPHTRVKPGFGRLALAIAAADTEGRDFEGEERGCEGEEGERFGDE